MSLLRRALRALLGPQPNGERDLLVHIDPGPLSAQQVHELLSDQVLGMRQQDDETPAEFDARIVRALNDMDDIGYTIDPL